MLSGKKTQTKKMFNWLVDLLDKAEKNNEIVYILNHLGLNAGFMMTECAKRFQALFDRYEYNIRGIFSGHTHKDDVELISGYFDNSRYVALNFIGPSLTTNPNVVPSYRIYEIGSKTYNIYDYEQYRFDLNKSNKEEIPYWYLSHKAIDLFKVKDMTEYKLIGELDDYSEYILKRYQDADWIKKHVKEESYIRKAKCIIHSNNYIDYEKCSGSKVGLNAYTLSLFSNYLIDPFTEGDE